MKTNIGKLTTALVALALSAGQIYATNITVHDYMVGQLFGGVAGADGVGVGNEDQETEPGTQQGQGWDMEAFAVVGTKLYLVGGYDMINGLQGYTSGDIFIKIGSPASPNPLTTSLATVQNGIAQPGYTAPYNYDFAIDLSGIGLTTSPMTTSAYNLSAASSLDTVTYDQFRGNPWRVTAGTTVDSTTTGVAIKYTTGLAATDTALTSLGVTGLLGGLHNLLEVDVSSFLSVPSGNTVHFSYTMGCGNDSIKGSYGGGFDAPDASSSIILIGLGLTAMAAFGMKRRVA